ncbi:NADAR family protein [Photobacterium leiognathi]|uniref:NADAR family protein n=1 Tax=Photobacterium leiognathi TaxID=553611 RepID=UPI00298138E8|nr:NADAR family protein [Photobacterium leiognathi]
MRIREDKILFWGGSYSNWFKREFNYRDITFSSAEKAIMFHKAVLFLDHDALDNIMSTNDVRKIKQFGRGVKGYNDALWRQVRVPVGVKVVRTKFLANDDLLKTMLEDFDFGNRSFVEASPHDDQWGVLLGENDKRCLDRHQWCGTNLLGLINDVVATQFCLRSNHELAKVPLNILIMYANFAKALSVKVTDAMGFTKVMCRASKDEAIQFRHYLEGDAENIAQFVEWVDIVFGYQDTNQCSYNWFDYIVDLEIEKWVA